MRDTNIKKRASRINTVKNILKTHSYVDGSKNESNYEYDVAYAVSYDVHK